MSESDSSSVSTSSEPPRGHSPAPESTSVPEIATASDPANGGLVIETKPPAPTELNSSATKPDASVPITVVPNTDADALNVICVDGPGQSLPPGQPEDIISNGVNVDFVVVPGVYGNGRWDDETKSGTGKWVNTYAEQLRSDCRILCYKYQAHFLFAGRQSAKAIRKCALKLLRALSAARQNEVQTRQIVFVAYDIGGIIVKDALIAASLERNSWNEILDRSRLIVFAGCPHRSVSSLDMEDRLSQFLFAKNNSAVAKVRPSASSISGMADSILQINGLFVESKVPLRSWIISFYGGAEQGILHIDQVFDAQSGTIGIPLEKRILDPNPLEPSDNINGSAMIPCIDGLKERVLASENQEHLRCERKLLSLASPVYPFQTTYSRDCFLAESDEYHEWLGRPGPQILYVHGTHHVRETAEQAFYALEELGKRAGRAIVLYFSFDRWDVRCDSIRDMLSTFLSQIISSHPDSSRVLRADADAVQHHQRHAGTEEDLFYWFERVKLVVAFKDLICVINNFDECTKESRKLFLDNFACVSQATERPWKVLITSQKPGALLDEVSGPSCVVLDLTASGAETNNIADVEKDTTRLITLRPELLSQEILVREEMQTINGLSSLVRHIICEQARVRCEWPEEITIKEIFNSLELVPSPTHDDHMLEQILQLVLSKIPEQRTLRQALSWLLYSVRPLTMEELSTVLYLGSDDDQEGLASPSTSVLEKLRSQVETQFAGIIDVDHNEVKIRHPRLRKILMGQYKTEPASKEPMFLWEEVNQTAHSDIASLCLEYLCRPSVQEIIDNAFSVKDPETFETPAVTDRSNLCSYAVQAWTHHFSLGNPNPKLSKMLSECASPGLVRSWSVAYWALSKRVATSSACLETLFPIFAGLGLLDVVQPRDDADASRGLLEAASKGQSRAVKRLLKSHDFSESVLLDTLMAAQSSGNEEMLLDLLDCLTSRSTASKRIVWPAALIYRAAWLGLDRFAERVLELGCPADPAVGKECIGTPLYDAVRNGHTETVRALLRHNAKINLDGVYFDEPLHVAAGRGHAEVVKVLVEEGKAELEKPNVEGRTALYFACLFGHHQVVETLLQMGADPDMGIPPGIISAKWSPLLAAADGGFKRCVQLLLDKKANPNIGGPSEIGTPLRYAAVGGHTEACATLLAGGADPNSSLVNPPILTQVITNNSFGTNQLEVLDLLLSHGADVNARDSLGATALQHAVAADSGHDEALARRLLDHGANVNMVNRQGRGALSIAAQEKRQDLVELLLQRNAEVNSVDTENFTPLRYAAYAAGNAGTMRILLEHGADPDLYGPGVLSPLMVAATSGNADLVELLLKHNAAVDLKFTGDEESNYWDGSTALIFAAHNGHGDIVRMLVENGASLKHIPAHRTPTIHTAAQTDILSSIIEFQAKFDINQTDADTGNTALHLSLDYNVFKTLVNAGASLEIQNSTRGNTPLSTAAYRGDRRAVEYLLKQGVDINFGSPCDGAPLHQACRSSRWDVIKLLVEKGADINQPCDGLAGTPLQAACLQFYYIERPAEDTVNYLLEQGADVTAQGGLLGFPIIAAALNGTPSLISLLVDKGAKTNVSDGMGRMPIHLAALRGIDNFQEILNLGGDIKARDAMGRTALHWAAQSGRVRAVESIISLSDRGAVDSPDIDGWTPLCWAARGPKGWLGDEGEPQDQVKVIKLLLENGASTSAVGLVGMQKWTPLKIARFSDQPADVIDLLTRRQTDDDLVCPNEDETSSPAAKQQAYNCDSCQCQVYGYAYGCKNCFDFDLCFKCYSHRDLIHSPEHIFEQIGPEFDEDNAVHSDEDSASSDSDSE